MTPMEALNQTRELLESTGMKVSNRGWNADGLYHQTVTNAAGYLVGTLVSLAGGAGACDFVGRLSQLQAMAQATAAAPVYYDRDGAAYVATGEFRAPVNGEPCLFLNTFAVDSRALGGTIPAEIVRRVG